MAPSVGLDPNAKEWTPPSSPASGAGIIYIIFSLAGVALLCVFLEGSYYAPVGYFSIGTRNKTASGRLQEGGQSKFAELLDAAYYRSLGMEGRLGRPPPPTLPRRVYNRSEYPAQYLTTGGLGETDRALLGKVYSEVNSSFEYGLGESTFIAAWTGMPRWSGIDSDPKYVADVRSKPLVPSHFQFNFGDIGPTGAWGWPEQRGRRPNFERKQLLRYIWAPLALEREAFDVYLVDGRWRVACACASFLHAIGAGGDMERVRVMVHDYGEKSRGYQVIEEEIADIDAMSDHLAVFKLKPGIDEGDIERLYLRHTDQPKRRR